ncbi:MAG: nucleoside phosphorylase [Peptostreptococcaceae bacterium]
MQPHIHLEECHTAKYALLPGDHKRLDIIKGFLDNVEELKFNREYRSISGYYKGIKVLAVSTGIGGTSAAIAIEELNNIGVKTMIRVGSCGALQSNIELGDLILVNGAVRDEGTSKAYMDSIFPAVPNTELLFDIVESARELKAKNHIGKIRSNDSFYTDDTQEIDNYWSERGILGSDMESAALFVVCDVRDIKCASILNNVVEFGQKAEDGVGNYLSGDEAIKNGEKMEILVALEAIVKQENR